MFFQSSTWLSNSDRYKSGNQLARSARSLKGSHAHPVWAGSDWLESVWHCLSTLYIGLAKSKSSMHAKVLHSAPGDLWPLRALPPPDTRAPGPSSVTVTSIYSFCPDHVGLPTVPIHSGTARPVGAACARHRVCAVADAGCVRNSGPGVVTSRGSRRILVAVYAPAAPSCGL